MRRLWDGRFRGLLTLIVVLCLTTTGLAWPPGGNGGGKGGGGNGGGEDPPPEPAPVNYGLIRFSMPSDYQGGTVAIEGMNQFGEAVGYYRIADGYAQPLYIDINDIDGDAVVFANLNDLYPDLTALDIEPPTVDPTDLEGWEISHGFGINNLGDIAVGLTPEEDPYGLDLIRGAVLELRPAPTDPTVGPRLHLIPDAAWSHTYARRINDAGIVLGRGDSATPYIYQPGLHGTVADADVEILPLNVDPWVVKMNNPTAGHGTQLAWGGSGVWRYTLGDANPVLLTNEVTLGGGNCSLSDSGAISGHRNIRKNKSIGAVYDGTVIDFPDLKFARGLNASADVVGESLSSDQFTLDHATHGALNLEQLTVTMTSQDQQIWDNSDIVLYGITERDVLGTDPSVADFPVVYGFLRRYDTELSFHYDGVVLLPIPPQ